MGVSKSLNFNKGGLGGGEKPKSSAAPRGGNAGGNKYQPDDNVSQASSRVNTKSGGIDVDNLMSKIRAKLATRGTKGFIGIQRQFKIMDDDGDHSISYNEFAKAMKQYKIELSEPEARAVFADFDEDGDGTVSIDEFIRELRGEMNDFRKALAMKAFQIMDRDNDGVIRVNDIKGVYSAKMHPDVKSGKKTEDEVLGEFLDTFEMHHGLHASNPKEQAVTSKEFVEYYNHVSASIDNDQYFELMMINGYKLWNYNSKYKDYAPTNSGKGEEVKVNNKPSSTTAPYGTSNNTHDWSTSNRPVTAQDRPKSSANNTKVGDKVGEKVGDAAGVPSWPGSGKGDGKGDNTSQQGGQTQGGSRKGDQLVQVFRDKVAARGTRGIFSMGRMFRIVDDDGSRTLSRSEWAKCLKDYRMDMNEDEGETLFKVFDRDGDGEIDYDEFLRAIRGPMNAARQKFVKLAFGKLDKDGDGEITLSEIRTIYNAKQHPDVKSGKKTEDEVLGEFLDTFEDHHANHTGDHTLSQHGVSYVEFLEYYNNVSMSIDDDRYWELMMTNAWNLNNVSNAKGWSNK